jgi:hypothetical protein
MWYFINSGTASHIAFIQNVWWMSEKVRVANEMPEMPDRKFRDKKVL